MPDTSQINFQWINILLLVAALILPPIAWQFKRKKVWAVEKNRLAPLWERGVARFIDAVICFAAIWALGRLLPPGADGEPYPFKNLVSFVGAWLYFAGFECSNFRATPGKMMQNLVVSRADGKKMGFTLASVRFFGTILADIPFFLGHATWLFTPYRQTFQDLVTDTLVVKKELPSPQSRV